jgi:hypothetical protein
MLPGERSNGDDRRSRERKAGGIHQPSSLALGKSQLL